MAFEKLSEAGKKGLGQPVTGVSVRWRIPIYAHVKADRCGPAGRMENLIAAIKVSVNEVELLWRCHRLLWINFA